MKYKIRVIGVLVVAILSLTACNGENSKTGSAKKTVTVNGTEPQNGLIPTNTIEVGGGRVVGLLFSQLIHYDAKGGLQFDAAKDIFTAESKVYQITLKEGLTFTNGEPVNSAAFISAWNYGALATNTQLGANSFAPIAGYDLVSEINPETGQPFAQTMSGLEAINDQVFKITLTEANSDFMVRLGHTAFAPLPKVAFADMEAFGQNPVGNGPYKLASVGAWLHNKKIDLVANSDYKGEFSAKNGGITFELYNSLTAAYQNLQANNLDVLDSIPNSAFKTYTHDLDNRVISAQTARVATLSIPEYLTQWSGEVGKLRRKAVSYAINREEIAKIVFDNTITVAVDFSSPVIPGWSDNLAGNEVLQYDPEKAKQLWAQAETIQPWDDAETFTLAYNSDGDDKVWVDAVSNSLKNIFGIKTEGKPYPTFAALRAEVTSGALTGAARARWQADYPSLANFLLPNFFAGTGSNDSKYNNPQFDALMEQGNTAKSVENGIGFYQKGEELLLQDLPEIPLWYNKSIGGYSKNVTNVNFAWNGEIMYANIVVN